MQGADLLGEWAQLLFCCFLKEMHIFKHNPDENLEFWSSITDFHLSDLPS